MGDTQGTVPSRTLRARRVETPVSRTDAVIPEASGDGASADALTAERIEAILTEARARGERAAGSITLLVPPPRIAPRPGSTKSMASD
jgi:hypothetical protein